MRETLETNRDWDANPDLVWSALNVLAETLEAQGKYQEEATVAKEERMRSILFLCSAILPLFVLGNVTSVKAQEKGKNCRMEQQCHWENFKKICVWVKVCR